MTPPTLPRGLDGKGLRKALRYLHGQDHGSLRAGARILLTPYRTVQHWANNERPIPGTAVAALRYAVQLRQALEA